MIVFNLLERMLINGELKKILRKLSWLTLISYTLSLKKIINYLL